MIMFCGVKYSRMLQVDDGQAAVGTPHVAGFGVLLPTSAGMAFLCGGVS